MVAALKLAFVSALAALSTVAAYEVKFEDSDWSRQICSGMWGDQKTYINVTFDASSQGQVAMVIYEWEDVRYLGKETNPNSDEDDLPKTYVCTARAVTQGLCTTDQLGSFILDLPASKPANETSFWSTQLQLPSKTSGQRDEGPTPTQDGAPGFWNNPAGNPTPPPSNYTSPWRRRSIPLSERAVLETRQGAANVHVYTDPIQYPVRKTGYYCVAIVPLTALLNNRADTDVPFHPTYEGTVFFRNKFDGKLPASDYPKVNFYSIMSLVYVAFAALWGWRCYKYMHELLPIQHYLSSLVFLLVIEMVANWAYYRYLNSHGKGTVSTIFLIIVSIIDAGRNSLSFLLLLVVSLGLSVVRESLGRTMLKCQILAGAHFIFGILYAVGIVELSLESTSALVLLLFVIPLAFTLSGFLLWIMYALNVTIVQLRARKQRYKLRMFERLYYILLATVLVIAAFFVVSSFSFSGRLAEDYAAKSWKSRWWLLDGWLALLYLATFGTIAYLWSPSANNQRLAMSDEIAQDEEDAEDYDLEALNSRTRARDDDDDATLVGGRPGGHEPIPPGQDVVFEIGDEEDEDEDKKQHRRRLSGEQPHGEEHEREGLMGEQGRSRRD